MGELLTFPLAGKFKEEHDRKVRIRARFGLKGKSDPTLSVQRHEVSHTFVGMTSEQLYNLDLLSSENPDAPFVHSCQRELMGDDEV